MSVARIMQLAAAGAGGGYWISLLGGANDDSAGGVAVDSAANIIFCGTTRSDGAGGADILVSKHNSSGILQWDKTLGGASDDFGSGVAVDSTDNIVVCGTTRSSGSGFSSLVVAKYNSSGILQWDKTLSRVGQETGNGVAVDSADNIIVCGFTNSTGAGNADFLIAKYNSSGVLQWQKVLGGAGFEFSRGVAVDSADNIIVCGYTDTTGAGGNDFLIAKYNSSGAIQWQRLLGGASSDIAYSIAVDSANNIIVCGTSDSDGAGGFDLLLAKYNSSGALQWDKTLGGSGFDGGNGVAIDSSNNIIVCGQCQSDGAGGADILIAKYNSSGALQWDKTLGGSGSDVGNKVTVDSSDNIVVCGYTDSDGAGGNDCLVAKLPPDGTGDGTYGGLIYQDAVLTDAAAVLTSSTPTLSNSNGNLIGADAGLTDAAAVLTEERFRVAP